MRFATIISLFFIFCFSKFFFEDNEPLKRSAGKDDAKPGLSPGLTANKKNNADTFFYRNLLQINKKQ